MTVPTFPFISFRLNILPETVSGKENPGATVPSSSIFDGVFDIFYRFQFKKDINFNNVKIMKLLFIQTILHIFTIQTD
jgi:hypothetical protein